MSDIRNTSETNHSIDPTPAPEGAPVAKCAGPRNAPLSSSPLKKIPLPNVGDLLFIGICQLLLFMRPSFIFTDGATGWHLVTGMTILATGAVPRSDIMSYTFPGKAWIPYEWFSDVLMAMLVKLGGFDLLALAVTVAIASLVLAIYQRMRASDCHFVGALTICIFGLLASANHWLVRPHLFTFWGVYIFFTRLEDYYLNKISFARLCCWLLPYMVLWVNCHPAFLLGFAICGIYLFATTIKMLNSTEEDSRRQFMSKSLRLCALLVGLLIASFINPFGMQLYHYIAEYLHGTSILAQTDEFKSPNFHFNIHAMCLEILFFCLALGFIKGGKKVTLPSFIMTIVFGHLALSAVRNISLFAFVTMPVLGKLFGRDASPDTGAAAAGTGDRDAAADISTAPPGEAPAESILSSLFSRVARPLSEFNAQEKLSDMHFLPLAYVLSLACVAVFGGRDQANALMHSGFDPESQPIQTLDYIKDNKLEAKEGLSLDNWGGILRYQLDMPVFIDDRADFYGEKFYNEYGTICEIRPGYLVLLDKHKINWVLFPRESQLVQALKARADWKVVCQDRASSLLVRNPGTK